MASMEKGFSNRLLEISDEDMPLPLKGWNEKANSFVNRPPSSHIVENALPLCVLHLYIITCPLKGLCHGCLAHFVYLSNRSHFLWVYWRDTHAGCWENTRKDYNESRPEGEWFTSIWVFSQHPYLCYFHEYNRICFA